MKHYQSQPLPAVLEHLLTPKDSGTELALPEHPKQPTIKATPVPDFKKLHASIENKPRPQSVTKPVEFRLSTSKSRPEISGKPDDSQFEAYRRSKLKANMQFMRKSIEAKVDIPKTKKYESMVKMRESLD